MESVTELTVSSCSIGGTEGVGSRTQQVVGGNRSQGPTYIPGRNKICSRGVLRLYCSSTLNDVVGSSLLLDCCCFVLLAATEADAAGPPMLPFTLLGEDDTDEK